MSLAAPGQKRSQWVVIVAACAALAAAASIFVITQHPHQGGSSSNASAPSDPAVPAEVHETWKVRTYPTGSVGHITKAQRAKVEGQEPKINDLVRSLYGAVFLKPSQLDKAVASTFSPSAAKALRKTHVGLPRGTRTIDRLRVAAKVGIQAQGASRAAALVRVVVAGEARGKEFSLIHRGSLWLERRTGAWKVVGFDLEQSPYKASKKHDHDKKAKK